MNKPRRIALLIVMAAAAIAAAVFFIGGSKFSNGNVFSYLESLVNDLGKGNHIAACERIAEGASFSINDLVSRPAKSLTGGKSDLCGEFTLQAIAYTSGLVKDSFYKADLKVKRDLLNWNRASVTYNEHHDVQKYEVANPIKSVHHVHIVLEGRGNDLLITEWNEVVEQER